MVLWLFCSHCDSVTAVPSDYTNLICESAYRLLLSALTIAVYYCYLAKKLILTLLSHGWWSLVDLGTVGKYAALISGCILQPAWDVAVASLTPQSGMLPPDHCDVYNPESCGCACVCLHYVTCGCVTWWVCICWRPVLHCGPRMTTSRAICRLLTTMMRKITTSVMTITSMMMGRREI